MCIFYGAKATEHTLNEFEVQLYESVAIALKCAADYSILVYKKSIKDWKDQNDQIE